VPTCVVAEDEQLLREDLVAQLRALWPELEVLAAVEDGGAALEEIVEGQPDFAFLDIRMPGLNGIEVAAALAESSPATRVVFVTAYNQYAVDAFEQGAVDYVLKPLARERLQATIARLKARGLASGDADALLALLAQLKNRDEAKAKPLAWITAASGKDTRLIMVDDILYFQADNKYTIAMTAEGEALLRKPIKELLVELDAALFRQVHRSTIVNLKAIKSISRDEMGRGTIQFRTRPETVQVSAPFMTLFRGM
jgi:DNA-binding LytR/AlgR family response regulator